MLTKMESVRQKSPRLQQAGSSTDDRKETKSKGFNLNYMHNPPTIMPNLGKKRKSALPKTNVSRVLLYDNVTQQQMLDVKLSHIKVEQHRSCRLLDLHKKSFLTRQKRRQQRLQEAGITLPEIEPKPKSSSSPTRIPSRTSVKSPERQPTEITEELETLKLPSLEDNDNNNKRHVIFKLKDANGHTQVFHTYDEENGIFSEIVPLHSFYAKTTDDPRFQGLEGALVKSAAPSEGFNELSPSFRRESTKYPEHLIAFIHMNQP
ncbi:uncharacterized protein LOC134244197 isoform X1 [Saccostrea cucullata]|uniref:uncharacterized protein LOC134244197 isoform X1 n=2 Tax=Saccostrea cuccullata TaxID=36930 RepID=UPI002ED1A1D8